MPKHQPTILALACPLDLRQTLTSGQCFSWREEENTGAWGGWLAGKPCTLSTDPASGTLQATGVTADDIRRYFNLALPDDEIRDTFPDDPHLRSALDHQPGLRLIRDDPWECMVNFLCSSQKQIPQIMLLNQRLRQIPGRGGAGAFPGPEKILKAGEACLRRCQLGYRARFVHATAKAICQGQWQWETLDALDTDAAAEYLCRLPGIGPKIAHCILLYGCGRLDAFPIDVWMSRLLRQLYFPNQPKSPSAETLLRFGRDHFGPYCGLAQLHLFHAFRSGLYHRHTA